jgi:hypothetical protein
MSMSIKEQASGNLKVAVTAWENSTTDHQIDRAKFLMEEAKIRALISITEQLESLNERVTILANVLRNK